MSDFTTGPVSHGGRTWIIPPEELASLCEQVWPGARSAGLTELFAPINRETVRRYFRPIEEERAIPLPPEKFKILVDYIGKRAKTLDDLNTKLAPIAANADKLIG